jgi:hypothetical protein
VDKRELLSAIKRVSSDSFKRVVIIIIIIACTGVLTSAVKHLTDFHEGGKHHWPRFLCGDEMTLPFLR